jgi:hypothetical protein
MAGRTMWHGWGIAEVHPGYKILGFFEGTRFVEEALANKQAYDWAKKPAVGLREYAPLGEYFGIAIKGY